MRPQTFPLPAPPRIRHDSPVRAWHLLIGMMAGAMTLGPCPAEAQSIGDWDGTYHAPPTPKPTPTVKSSPPRIVPSPVITATPTAHPRRKEPVRRRARLAATPAPTPAPQAPPSPTPMPAPVQTTPSPLPSVATPPPVATVLMPKPRTLPHPAPPPSPDLPQWPLGLAALLGGAAGWALWRRKSAPTLQDEPEPLADLPFAPVPAPAQAPPEPALMPPPPAEPRFTPSPATARASGDLALDFIPTRLTTTLTEAILRYSLTVTNLGHAALGPLVIAGAMEAAGQDEPAEPDRAPSHSPVFRPAPGFSPHPQFTPMIVPTDQPPPPAPDPAPGPAAMEECHRLASLASGESAELRGQLRLPLADITPMRVGPASLFIPLVRLSVEAGRIADGGTAAPPVTAELCMMVGETPQTPSDRADTGQVALGPFRLDAGPATARHLAARSVPITDGVIHAPL